MRDQRLTRRRAGRRHTALRSHRRRYRTALTAGSARRCHCHPPPTATVAVPLCRCHRRHLYTCRAEGQGVGRGDTRERWRGDGWAEGGEC